MKKLLILFGIILSIGLSAQIPGNPDASGVITPGPPDFVTGAVPGDGELKLQFVYQNSRSDSLRNVVNPADSTGNFTTINVDSAVIVVLNYSPSHGSMAFADSAAVIPLSQNVWSKVTNGNNDLFTIINGDDLTVDGDTITVTISGDYIVWWDLSFMGGPSDQYHAAVYKNATITPFEMHRKTSNNDTGNMGLNGYLDNLAAGDDISFYIRNTGDNDDPTLVSSQITIFMLHPR